MKEILLSAYWNSVNKAKNTCLYNVNSINKQNVYLYNEPLPSGLQQDAALEMMSHIWGNGKAF